MNNCLGCGGKPHNLNELNQNGVICPGGARLKTLDKWEAEAKLRNDEYKRLAFGDKLSSELDQERILALIDLVRKKELIFEELVSFVHEKSYENEILRITTKRHALTELLK